MALLALLESPRAPPGPGMMKIRAAAEGKARSPQVLQCRRRELCRAVRTGLGKVLEADVAATLEEILLLNDSISAQFCVRLCQQIPPVHTF